METLLLFPVDADYLCYLGVTGWGAFPSPLLHDNLLLPLASVITPTPLLWFAAAQRLRLATIGFMQYLTPTLHFLLAVLVFGEPFSRSALVSFVCIWTGLGPYSWYAARSWRHQG